MGSIFADNSYFAKVIPSEILSKLNQMMNEPLSKLDFLTFIAGVDLICMLVFLYTIMQLKALSDDRLNEIQHNLVEVKDFAL